MFEFISRTFIKKFTFNIAIIKRNTIIAINNVIKINIFIIYLMIDLNSTLNINYQFREYIYAKKNLSLSKNIFSKINILVLILNLL